MTTPYNVVEHGCHAELVGPEMSESFQNRNKARIWAARLNMAFNCGAIYGLKEGQEIAVHAINNSSPSQATPIAKA